MCNKNGLIISVTNSDWLFSKNWLTIDNKFSENNSLNDGNIAKVYLKDAEIELLDYFWSEKKYIECFQQAGYENLILKHTLGNSFDTFDWIDETKYPPFAIYLYKK